jgi:hypothetical protein
VVAKGTTAGITTDSGGKYALLIPTEAKTLVFSFVGMMTQEVAVSAKSVYDVVLSEETIGVDEVVVVGYGTIKKKRLDRVGCFNS